MNDLHTLIANLGLLILIAVITPFTYSAFDTNYNDNDVAGFQNSIQEQDATDVSATLIILKAVAGVFFWSFGNLPYFLDIVLFLPRLIMYLSFARWIRGVG